MNMKHNRTSDVITHDAGARWHVPPTIGRGARDEEEILRALVTEYVANLISLAFATYASGDPDGAQREWNKALDVADAAAIERETVFVLATQERQNYSAHARFPFEMPF